MEIFLMLLAVLGTIGTVASNVITNNQNLQNSENQLGEQHEFSHNEAELANQRALENYWNTQSPQARVQQFKEAGLSTGLMYGGNGTGGVSVTSQASTPGASLPTMVSPMQNGLNDIFENLKKIKETENIGEDTEKIKEETNKIKSEIDVNNATINQIATENNLTEVLTANAKLDGTIKDIEVQIKENTKENTIKIVAQQLANMENEGKKMIEEIEGLKIDNDNKEKLYDATIKKMAAETNLTWKQAAKTEQEKLMIQATQILTDEQTQLTFGQRQMLYKQIEQLKNINAKIDAEIKLIEQQTGKTKLEKVTEIIGWIEQSSKIAENISGTVLKAALLPK